MNPIKKKHLPLKKCGVHKLLAAWRMVGFVFLDTKHRFSWLFKEMRQYLGSEAGI